MLMTMAMLNLGGGPSPTAELPEGDGELQLSRLAFASTVIMSSQEEAITANSSARDFFNLDCVATIISSTRSPTAWEAPVISAKAASSSLVTSSMLGLLAVGWEVHRRASSNSASSLSSDTLLKTGTRKAAALRSRMSGSSCTWMDEQRREESWLQYMM